MDDLQQQFGFDLMGEELDRVSSINGQVLLARYSQFFDDYVAFTQTQQYKELYRNATQVADSLSGYVSEEFDDRSRTMIALKEKLDYLRDYQDSVVAELDGITYELRTHSRALVDSVRILVAGLQEEVLLRKLRAEGKITGLQRILLATKDFSIGNTRLADVGNTSIGLPIRGINYTYDRGGVSATLVYGSRILSRRNTPREGIAFHDLNKDLTVGQFGLGYQSQESHYQLFVTNSREQGGFARSGTAVAALPRTNRVVTIEGVTGLHKGMSLITSVSHAATRMAGDPASIQGEESSRTNDVSMRAGVEMSMKKFEVSLSAFRTGSTFRSFANPYLYTDYQGVEGIVSAKGLARTIDASLSLAGGFGTTEESKEDFRLHAQGQLAIRLTTASSLLLLISPNIYRYSVTGKEGFSESSIYNLLYQVSTQVFGMPAHLNIGLTNLNQGVSWADSTAVSNDIVGTATGMLMLSEAASLSLDCQHNMTGGSQRAAPQYNYAIKGTHGKKLKIGAGLTYGIYAFEAAPGWGANVDVQLPISQWAIVRASLYYRPQRAFDDRPSTIPQLFSQQSWQATF